MLTVSPATCPACYLPDVTDRVEPLAQGGAELLYLHLRPPWTGLQLPQHHFLWPFLNPGSSNWDWLTSWGDLDWAPWVLEPWVLEPWVLVYVSSFA